MLFLYGSSSTNLQNQSIRWCLGMLLCTTLHFPTLTHSQELRESTDPYFDAKKPAHFQTSKPNGSDPLQGNATFTSYNPKQKNSSRQQDAKGDDGNSSNRIDLLGSVPDSSQPGNVSQASFHSTLPNPGKPFQPSRVLAIVGTEPIFAADLMLEMNQLVEQFMPTAPKEIKQQQMALLIKRLLPKYIEQKLLLVDTIRQLPEEVDFEEIIEQAVKEFDNNAMEKMMEGFGATSTADFDAILRAQGSSLRKLRRSWSIDQLVRYFLSQKMEIDSEVSHGEMLKYYRDHLDEYDFPAKARWQQVMIKFSTTGSFSKAQQRIVEIGNQIVYGASMEAVAKKESNGFKAATGGIHDWTTKGSLVHQALNDAIFTLPTGVLSDVIETSEGLHIIRVIERTDAGAKPFRDAQVEIRKKLEEEKREAAVADHIARLKREIPVEIYDISK